MPLGAVIVTVVCLHCLIWYGHAVLGMDQNIAVVGLFQVKESASGHCDDSKTYVPSVMAIEAIKWTFRNLYDNGDAPAINLIPYKTCGLSDETTADIVNILADNSPQPQYHIAGIIGPEFSEEAKIVSEIITSLPVSQHIAQVSYSATAQLLSDKSKYPNFFRVIPNDDKQVQTMVQLMLQLEWNRIAIVHDDDLYGKEVAKALRTMATHHGICIPTIQELAAGAFTSDQYQRVLDEILINAKPSIKGLVLIGRRDVAYLFMKFLSKDSKFTNTPALILAESVQLQRDAFSDTNGAIFERSKGSYVLSPDYIQVTEFADYWRRLYSNHTQLLDESTTNPWLLDVYEESFNCRPDDSSSCPTVSENRIDQYFSEQPLYVRYAMVAAYTLAEAIRKTVVKTCGNETVCDEFFNNTDSADVLKQMHDLTFSIGHDFEFKPRGLRDVSISFGASSGDNLINGHYKVYNLRENASNDEQFIFDEIAVYNGSSIDVNTAKIIDYYYDSSGQLHGFPWPDVRKAQCPVGYLCSECISSHAVDDFVFIEGDLYVIALVPYRESDSKLGCGELTEASLNGFGNSVAMLKAVDDSNRNHQFGLQRVGLVIFDSCSNPILSDWRMKDLLKSGLNLKNGTTIDIADRILGVAAEYFSSISVAISKTLASQKILQLAYGATSPALSNRDAFPYFIRVATPDQIQTRLAVKLLKQMNANYVQLIYSEDAYGEGFRGEFTATAKRESICVANEIGLSAESSAKINQIYETLRNKPFAKLVVVALSTFVNEVLETITAFMDSGEFLFLGSESWGLDLNRLRQENSHKLLGSITIHLELSDMFDIGEAMKDVDVDSDARNPWTEDYLQSAMDCYYETSFDKQFTSKCSQSFRQFWEANNVQLSSWGPFSYLGIQSLLNGTSRFFFDKCPNRNEVCDAYREDIDDLIELMKETSTIDLLGTGQLSRVYDDNGDGNVGYVIYNIRKSKENPSVLDYVEVGRYSADGSLHLIQDLILTPSTEPFVSVCPNKKACDECLKVPTEPAPTAAKSPPPKTAIVLGSVVGILVLALIILCLVICYMRRRIKNLQPGGDGYLTPTDVTKHFDNNVYEGKIEDIRDERF